MPCDTRTTVSVALNAADKELLFKAIAELGWQPREIGGVIQCYVPGLGTVSIEGGMAKITTYAYTADDRTEGIVNKIKKAYSTEVVKAQAKKFGWQLKQTSENKFKALRRF